MRLTLGSAFAYWPKPFLNPSLLLVDLGLYWHLVLFEQGVSFVVCTNSCVIPVHGQRRPGFREAPRSKFTT